ncbi:MAG: 7-carboxy-7-deazaguanine synthase QueE [Gammaproteobacteria bacterium]|nr:7-carboxy-7-deazaguanine synthase QueE [Gammaproteobacteria bacterium]
MRVSELFHSIQGEGHLTGKPMFFVRAQGCAVKCPIREVCDQPESLGFKGGSEHSAAELADFAVNAVGARGWVCLTGGEPLEQADFDQVVAACRKRGLYINVQTSGLHRVNAPWDWCTVSPKAPVDKLALNFAQELKLIYTGQSNDELRGYYERFSAWNYYLQPEWRDGGSNQAATLAKVFELNALGMYWEFSAQWHKFLGVR